MSYGGHAEGSRGDGRGGSGVRGYTSHLWPPGPRARPPPSGGSGVRVGAARQFQGSRAPRPRSRRGCARPARISICCRYGVRAGVREDQVGGEVDMRVPMWSLTKSRHRRRARSTPRPARPDDAVRARSRAARDAPGGLRRPTARAPSAEPRRRTVPRPPRRPTRRPRPPVRRRGPPPAGRSAPGCRAARCRRRPRGRGRARRPSRRRLRDGVRLLPVVRDVDDQVGPYGPDGPVVQALARARVRDVGQGTGLDAVGLVTVVARSVHPDGPHPQIPQCRARADVDSGHCWAAPCAVT